MTAAIAVVRERRKMMSKFVRKIASLAKPRSHALLNHAAYLVLAPHQPRHVLAERGASLSEAISSRTFRQALDESR
jgi:hypothetical protein